MLWLKEVEFIKSVPINDCYVESVTLFEDNVESIQGHTEGVRINVETGDISKWYIVPWSNVLYAEESDDDG